MRDASGMPPVAGLCRCLRERLGGCSRPAAGPRAQSDGLQARLLIVFAVAFATIHLGCGDPAPPFQADAGHDAVADSAPVDAPAGGDLTVDIPLSDAPQPGPAVTAVTDDGQDGTAVVGEMVTLQGTDFGTNCRVLFGAVEAKVTSRSQIDLRFQVPEGIAVGMQQVLLDCDNGQATFDLQVLRYHLISSPQKNQVSVLQELSPNKIEDANRTITFARAERIVLSPDSAHAYVGTARSSTEAPEIGIIDLCASGGPVLLAQTVPYDEPVSMPVFGLAAAADAPVLAVAGGLYVVFYDISDPLQPLKRSTVQLLSAPPNTVLPTLEAGFFIDVAVSPDGTTAALLDGAADELHVYDITQLDQPQATHTQIKVSAGTPLQPVVTLPFPISGLLSLIKVQGGSSQEVAVSADGRRAIVLAGGGLGALVPETYNLDLGNTTISIVDLKSGGYVNKLQKLPDAHLPNSVAFAPNGDAYVTSLSSASALLLKVLFDIGVKALISGGLSLLDIAGLLFKNFSDVIDVIKATFDGTLFHFGGLHRVVPGNASLGSFSKVPYAQGGLCSTYDGSRLLVSSQRWAIDMVLDFPQVVKSFSFLYDVGYTLHDLPGKSHSYKPLFPWKAQLLLPPWSFGHAACQQ